MREMVAWDALSEEYRSKAIEVARSLVLASMKFASKVEPGGCVLEGGRLRSVYEENNRHLLGRLDNLVIRCLNKLVGASVPEPAKILYCAVWHEVMLVADDDMSEDFESVALLVMARVQSTAQVVHDYKLHPLRIEHIKGMQERRLI